MAAMNNLMVKDDTVTTPVEFTLKPITDNPAPLWRAEVANVPLDGQIRFSMTSEKVKSGAYKMSAKLEVPVLETLGASGTSAGYVAPPKVAYTDSAIFTMFSDRRATTQDRANVMKMMLGLLQGASETTATGVLNQASAGNAVVNSTLPVVNAFTRVVLPN